MTAISVLLVDDNDFLAASMERLLSKNPRFTWSGWIEDPTDLVERVRSKRPDLILMDVDMPGVEPFELVRLLAAEVPESKVVMFSGHVRNDYAEAALDAGAYGYLHKDDDLNALLENLGRAHGGEIVISPLVRQMLWRTT